MVNNDPNLILIKMIVSVFINHQLPEANGKLESLVDAILPTLKTPGVDLGEDSQAEITKGLKESLNWLRHVPLTAKVSAIDLTERVIMNCAFAGEYVESLKRILVLDKDDHINSERLKTLVGELQHAKRGHDFANMFKTANREINFGEKQLNIDEFVSAFSQELKDFEYGGSDKEHEGYGGCMSTIDEKSIADVIDKAKELDSDDGVLRTGLVGLNRALGGKGYRRGEQFNFGALTHNYKTGILLDHSRWFCMHNTPYLFDETKKPLILRVSFENKPEQDLPEIYESIWEAEHQKRCDFTKVNTKEAAKYIIDNLTRTGYNFEGLCYDPNNFDVWDLIEKLEGYRVRGYEIAAVIIDYPELICKKANANRRQDENINYTFEVLRNYCFPKNITQITAHQLSTEAQKMAREGAAGFAKKVAKGSYYMNSQSLATKLDGEIAMHIHQIGDESYLTFSRGKHRGHDKTPIKHRSFAYKFEEFGGLCDDIHLDEAKVLYSFAGIDGGAGGESLEEHGGMTTDTDW